MPDDATAGKDESPEDVANRIVRELMTLDHDLGNLRFWRVVQPNRKQRAILYGSGDAAVARIAKFFDATD